MYNVCILANIYTWKKLQWKNQGRSGLHSSDEIIIPWGKNSTFEARSFRIWNNLPDFLRSSESYTKFKTELKTYLYSKCYVRNENDLYVFIEMYSTVDMFNKALN